MATENKTSEFGKGFAYSLVLFAQHFENDLAVRIGHHHFIMSKSPEEREKILCDSPDPSHSYGFNKELKQWIETFVPIWGSEEATLAHDIEIWANGATDHLYEIEVPEKWANEKIGRMVEQLKDGGLVIGHGFTQAVWTMKDFAGLQTLTTKIAFELDKLLGVNPIEAKYK